MTNKDIVQKIAEMYQHKPDIEQDSIAHLAKAVLELYEKVESQYTIPWEPKE